MPVSVTRHLQQTASISFMLASPNQCLENVRLVADPWADSLTQCLGRCFKLSRPLYPLHRGLASANVCADVEVYFCSSQASALP